MASACVNNIGMSPDNFPSSAALTYGCLSPRISFSRDDDPSSSKNSPSKPSSAPPPPLDPLESAQGPAADFEFRLHEDAVTMLPADELFSDGKLVPLRITAATASTATSAKPYPPSPTKSIAVEEVKSPEAVRLWRRPEAEISTATDPFLFSPKAPRCASRWKELLGFRKAYNSQNPNATPNPKTNSSNNNHPNPKSLMHFLHRSSRSNTSLSSTSSSSSSNSAAFLDHSLSLPLLKDAAVLVSVSDCESISISSRLSLSSSSSGHDPHEDLPRLSLDSEKPSLHPNPSPNPFVLNRNPNPPRVRPMRKNPNPNPEEPLALSADSPRMNSSGKIVFQSLERSSSSPSSFNGNGGPRVKHRGMERSYSANVRVTPVLNVPVCSLRGSSKSGSVFGFGQLFSSSSSHGGGGKGQHSHSCSRNRTTDRN